MKFILNLQNAKVLSKNELKQIKGGNYTYYLNGYEVYCDRQLTQAPTCDYLPAYCLVHPDACPESR